MSDNFNTLPFFNLPDHNLFWMRFPVQSDQKELAKQIKHLAETHSSTLVDVRVVGIVGEELMVEVRLKPIPSDPTGGNC